MIKKILLTIFFLVSAGIIYFQHAAVYDSSSIQLFGYTLDASQELNSSYIKYFFLKDENPRFVWNSDVFKTYMKDCHEKKQNCMIFPHQQFYADLMWIGSIQYIGSVIDSVNAKYFYNVLDNLTTLSLYWNYPYAFGELLLPGNKDLAKGNKAETIKNSWLNSVKLGEKGRTYNCNNEKISRLQNVSSEKFYTLTYSKPIPAEYANPCTYSEIPAYLAFNYFYYLGDYEKAAEYYKIASLNDDSPTIYASMYGIVTGKGGNHQKSMQIWFSKVISLKEKLANGGNADEIKFYKDQLDEALKKGVFELQLDLLQNADKLTINNASCYHNYDCLVKDNYLKEVIEKEYSLCTNTKIDINSFTGTLKNDSDKEKFYNNVQCILFGYAIQNNYIDLNTFKMDYPFNSTFNGKMQFDWDTELNEWKVAIKN